MNKFARISIFALVALMGCTKVESDFGGSEPRIAFEVGTYAQRTKAGESSFLNEFTDPANASFNSKAFLHAYGEETQNYFGNGEVITWDASANEWAPSHDYYWPKSKLSYIDFFSWYDNSATPVLSYDESSNPTVATMTWSGRTIAPADNILIADAAWRQNANTSIYHLEHQSVVGVPTLFHHLLTNVQMNMSAATLTDPDNSSVTYEVVVQSVKIEGLYHQGTLTLTTSDPGAKGTSQWTASNPNLLWAPSGAASDVVINENSSTDDIPLTPSAQTVLAARSFMPQQLTDNIILVIKYTVTTKSNDTVTSSECDIPATLVLNTIKNSSNVAINTWLPNKKYTYNIIINPISKEILLDPSVDNWGALEFSATVE